MRGTRMGRTMLAVCLAACAAAAALGGAVEDRRYYCSALSQEPMLDGKVEGDAGWKETAAEERFFRFGSTEAPSRKTRFRIGCTDRALFIGVECEEPETDKLRASLPDMGELWTEDSVEVFILPRGSDAYYQFIVNAAGGRWNGIRGVSGVDLPLQDWQAKTVAAGGAWSVEMRIPWKVIKYVPGKDGEWGLNVCRNVVGAVGGTENLTWARMRESFHEAENFGKLLFARKVSPEGWEVRTARPRRREKAKVLLYSRPLGCKGKLGTFLQEGAAKRRISFIQGPHVAPRLSPDGKGVLLHSNQGGRTGVWLTDRRGGEPRRVCDGRHAEWSPDGKRIVFVREGKAVERELGSGDEKTVSPAGWSSCLFASYMPDGKALVVRGEGGGERLYLVDPKDGDGPRALIAGEIRSAPKASPDGKRVAYQNGAHLHLLDVEKGASTPLTLAGGVQSWPVWSEDGGAVYYCQRAEPYDEVGEIHAVRADEPGKAGLIQKDVNASFDWNGFVNGPVRKHELAGKSLEVARGEPLTVKNDWFVFRGHVDGGKVLITPQGRASGSPVEIGVAGDGAGMDSVALAERDPEHVEVEAQVGGRTKVIFRVHRTSPALEVEPAEAVTLRITADMSAVVVPDRYSNDLLLEPGSFRDSPTAALPRTPFLLGCFPGGGGILVASGDSTLVRGDDPDAFEGLIVRGGAIFAPLDGTACRRVEVKSADDGKWDIQWAAPFPARWRFAAAGGGLCHSRMWEGPAPAKGFVGPPESCAMYLYGRTPDTPLDVRTPVDILRDVYGVRECEKRLDIQGVRGFRSADEPVPFTDIFTRPHGWSPTLVHTKPGDLGILETMMGIGGVDVEPVRSLVRHLGGDIVNLLDGLDRRTKEYEAFVAGLRRDCRDSSAGAAGFTARIVLEADELQERLAGVKVTPLDEVRAAVEDVIKKDLKRGGHLYYRDEYKKLASVARAALVDRQKVLHAYREFAKRVRDEAGVEIIYAPELKGRCEAVRDMTRDILRNRYYLEGDWRGEKPLRGGIR